MGSQWLVEGTLLAAVVEGNPLDMAAVVAYTEEELAASLAADSTVVVVVVGLRRSELLTH